MSNSSLVTVKVPAHSGNYTKGRQSKISEITIHHMAGVLTAAQCGSIFARAGRNGSTHYGVGNDGSIGLYVDECNTAWSNSNWDSNCRAVTIETSNSKSGGDWPVSDAALSSLIKLVADIAKRNNLGTLVKGKNLTWHRMYAATSCPGEYLLSKMDYIVAEANKINFPVIKPNPSSYDYPYTTNTSRKTDDLVLYHNKVSTGTNKWGTECLISDNGVVLSKVSGKGDMKLECKKVLSGHGKASTWMDKIKVGYHVYFKDGRCFIDAGNYIDINAENDYRRSNQLIKYTRAFTNNKWGSMVAIDKNGVALSAPRYGLTTMNIPEGGYVLSGHGTASKWLLEKVRKGSKITKIGTSAIKVD